MCGAQVRAATHCDVFRLERVDFEAVMRDHPAGALHVADQLRHLLPPKVAARVVMQIYQSCGLRDLLGILQRKWRPPKGLAARIRALATSSTPPPGSRKAQSLSTPRRGSQMATKAAGSKSSPNGSDDATALPDATEEGTSSDGPSTPQRPGHAHRERLKTMTELSEFDEPSPQRMRTSCMNSPARSIHRSSTRGSTSYADVSDGAGGGGAAGGGAGYGGGSARGLEALQKELTALNAKHEAFAEDVRLSQRRIERQLEALSSALAGNNSSLRSGPQATPQARVATPGGSPSVMSPARHVLEGMQGQASMDMVDVPTTSL